MEVSGQIYTPAAVPREIIVAPIDCEAGWVPEPVWMFWRREKSLAPAEIRTPDRPAHTVVT
jgi:hypothetical protein